MKVVPSNKNEKPLPNLYWTTVQRDQAFERRLLAAINDVLNIDQSEPVIEAKIDK